MLEKLSATSPDWLALRSRFTDFVVEAFLAVSSRLQELALFAGEPLEIAHTTRPEISAQRPTASSLRWNFEA